MQPPIVIGLHPDPMQMWNQDPQQRSIALLKQTNLQVSVNGLNHITRPVKLEGGAVQKE
jgi:hypothetical protein